MISGDQSEGICGDCIVIDFAVDAAVMVIEEAGVVGCAAGLGPMISFLTLKH